MSNSSSLLGYGLALVVGVAAGFLAPGAGFSFFWALGAFATTASLLVRPPVPTNNNRPTDYGNSGRVANTRQAAAAELNINSASESIVVPVVFGTCRLNGNHIGYKGSTFRSVPIIERQERSPQFVAYRIAQEAFEASPSVVDHEIDRAARKNSESGGKGGKSGGKGGGGSAPPPSQSYSNADKINAYTAILLEKDESGKSKLPKEYDEFVVGFKYYLSFEIGICCGEISALHGVLSYPQEKYIIDRRESPYITADDTALVAGGAQEGGNVRFYRGSGSQTRNVADPYAADYNNYRGVSFATFEDYWIGTQPAPNSFVFEVERIPVCRDENGDVIADMQLRAGEDTEAVEVTVAVWAANVITVTAPGHGLSIGDVAFLADFEPDGFNGQFTVTGVTGDDWTGELITEPPVATRFGVVQGPPHGTANVLDDADWSDGQATLEYPGHGAAVDQLVELTDFTPTDWNGTWPVLTIDGDEFTVAMPGNPGAVTVMGKFRLYPVPSEITSANWEAGVVTFGASNDFDDLDVVIVSGMEPAIYNGSFTVQDGDSGGFDGVLVSPPAPATVMGTATGPAVDGPQDIQYVAEWVGGIVTFDMVGGYDGYEVDDIIVVAGMTPAGYNGTYTVTRKDGDQWSAALATNPGAATVMGTATRQPAAQEIQAARWEAGVVTFLVPQHGFFISDSIAIAGMEPTGYNGTFAITAANNDEFSAVLAADPGGVTTLGTSRLRPDADFGDANPAAILYELFTNKVWGRGMDPARIDQASFIRASQYYFDEGIGMSFTIESQGSLSDAIETLRAHVNLAIMWVGDKLYCQCLNDRATAYSPRVILTRDSVVDPEFTRPAWPSTFNEVRVQFLNRYNNYQSELALVHDDANIQTVGQVNSTKVELPAISNRETATLIAQRILFDMAYPQAQLKFRMARYHSGLYPSAFVEFQWPDWSDGIVTTYWRVQEITDDDQNTSGLMVTLVEDLYSTPVVGVPSGFTAPVPAYEGMTRNTNAQLFLGTDKTAPPALTGLFFQVAEMPISLTDADRIFGLMAQRKDGFSHAVKFLWKPVGGADYTLLGTTKPWGISGTLTDPLAATGLTMLRDVPFRLQLRYDSERAKFLEYCSRMPTASDGFDVVTGSQKNWLCIGNEFIEVGQAEAGAGDKEVIVTAYIRASYGAEMAAHSAGANCMFVYDFIPYAHTLRYDQMPVGVPIIIQAFPQDRFGRFGDPYSFRHTFENLAVKALRIERAEGIVVVDEWQVSYRPRFHNRGADIVPDITENCNMLTGEIPAGYELRVMPVNTQGGELIEEAELVDVTFIPDDPEGLDPETGMGEFTYTPPATTVALILYQVFNGILGLPCRLQLVADGGLLPDPTPVPQSFDGDVDYGWTFAQDESRFPGYRIGASGFERGDAGRQDTYLSLTQDYAEDTRGSGFPTMPPYTGPLNDWNATYAQGFGDPFYVFYPTAGQGTMPDQNQSYVTVNSTTVGTYSDPSMPLIAGGIATTSGTAGGSPVGIERAGQLNDVAPPADQAKVDFINTLGGTVYSWDDYMTDRTATPLADPTLSETATPSGTAQFGILIAALAPDRDRLRIGFAVHIAGTGERQIRWRVNVVSSNLWPASGTVLSSSSWTTETFMTDDETVNFNLEDYRADLYTDDDADFGDTVFIGVEIELLT